MCLDMRDAGLGSGCEKVKTEILSLLKELILTGVRPRVLVGFYGIIRGLNRNQVPFKVFQKYCKTRTWHRLI